MKALLKIFVLSLIYISVFQKVNAQSVASVKNIEKVKTAKFTHMTEFGFILGSQAPINNNYIAQPYAYDVKVAYGGGYYPYPTYYGSDHYSNFTFQHFSGYKVHNGIAVGLTGGLDYYRSNIITPLSLGVRSTLFPSKRISPIVNMDAGYGFLWGKKIEGTTKNGGLALNPSVGIRVKIGQDGSSLNINVGYKLQESKFITDRPSQEFYQTEYRSFNRLSIRLGLGF